MSLNLGIIASSRSSAPSVSLLLDTYSGAAAAYSLRKLRNAYSSAAIRVRRSSDNTETDIGFNVGGELDTTALTTFCGVGNGFVTIWYDQSGNVNDSIQSTTANQPQIVNSGIINLQGTKPCIKFDGNDWMANLSNGVLRLDQRTGFIVSRELTSVNYAGIVCFAPLTGNDYSNPNGGCFYTGDGGSNGNTNVSLATKILQLNGTKPMSYRLVNVYSDITNANLQVNNLTSISTSNDYTANKFQTGKIYLGIRFLSIPDITYAFNGIIQEIIMYNGSNQNTNVSAINSNINSYYSIY